jgi:YgiT-type zinc finger domain-containing protein
MDRVQREEEKMKPFEKCPVCGGELVEKQVEKLIRGGNNTAVLHVNAEVCQHCGERLFAQDTVQKFQDIRTRLERNETSSFKPVGQAYQVA